MVPDFDDCVELQAALALVFEGRSVANGYTELVVHPKRREAKRQSRR